MVHVFGFAAISSAINAVEHENSTTQSLSTGSLSASDGTFLLTGKINGKPNGTPDEFFLFNVADPAGTEPAEGLAFATHTADFDQSTFDIISMWDRPGAAGSFHLGSGQHADCGRWT